MGSCLYMLLSAPLRHVSMANSPLLAGTGALFDQPEILLRDVGSRVRAPGVGLQLQQGMAMRSCLHMGPSALPRHLCLARSRPLTRAGASEPPWPGCVVGCVACMRGMQHGVCNACKTSLPAFFSASVSSRSHEKAHHWKCLVHDMHLLMLLTRPLLC